MSNEFEIEDFKLLEYPENFLVVVYNPSSKEILLFPDAVDILLEALGYELFFAMSENIPEKFLKEKKITSDLVFRSYLDSSFLRIKSEIYVVPLETNLAIPLVSIRECYLTDDSYEENVTRKIKKLIELYPKKIDVFSVVGLDYEEENILHSNPNSKQNLVYHQYPYFMKKI